METRDLGRQHQEHPLEQPARRHSHLHHYRNVHSSRQHNHQHLHDIRSQNRRDTSDNDLQDTSDVVVIVETISVLQVTDLAGATIIRTLPHDYPAAPVVTTSSIEPTVADTTNQPSLTDLSDLSDLFDTTSTSSASDDGNGATDPSSSLSSSVIEEPTVTSSDSSMPISFPTLSYAPITSTPLSAAPVFPSLSGLSNFTLSSSSLSNSTASFQSFTVESASSFTVFGGASSTRSKTSHSSLSLSTKSIPGTSTTTPKSSSSVIYSTTSVQPEFTSLSGSDGIDSPTVTANAGDSTVIPPTTDVGSESGNVSAATIAGSVVGAISGLAIILLLAAAVLRWKKRQSSVNLIQASGNDRGHGATRTGRGGGPNGGGGGMSQRLSIPFAIPAALAKLSGQSRFSRSTVSSDGGERGFAKISGRKLPPVLQFGGDGYTDPRATMMSDQSIDYRASQNFFGEAPLARLAVGAPMLHETSIPVFHASPARTAVETPGSFSDPFSDDNVLESPTLPPDPLGRSQPSYDRSTRSHGSFSRFTEDI
ncbi:hypothetical protein RRF57_002876 [Xylaria bambusicola]|uniref:Mid2 domain-containing protein n=1 Tax=Xylaria bambusicola TaxID=326684 RepID=A0AAN7UKW9_9PEZI